MSVVVAPGKLLTVTRRLAARLNKSLRKPLTIESPTMIVPSLGFCSPWPFSLVSLFSVCSCWFWELALPFFFYCENVGTVDIRILMAHHLRNCSLEACLKFLNTISSDFSTSLFRFLFPLWYWQLLLHYWFPVDRDLCRASHSHPLVVHIPPAQLLKRICCQFLITT